MKENETDTLRMRIPRPRAGPLRNKRTYKKESVEQEITSYIQQLISMFVVSILFCCCFVHIYIFCFYTCNSVPF